MQKLSKVYLLCVIKSSVDFGYWLVYDFFFLFIEARCYYSLLCDLTFCICMYMYFFAFAEQSAKHVLADKCARVRIDKKNMIWRL